VFWFDGEVSVDDLSLSLACLWIGLRVMFIGTGSFLLK